MIFNITELETIISLIDYKIYVIELRRSYNHKNDPRELERLSEIASLTDLRIKVKEELTKLKEDKK